MKRWILMILMIMGLVPAVFAQSAPPQIYQAAVEAARAAKSDLGEPSNWTFEILAPVSVSSLGCPMVQGAEMGRSVTPYRISLTYPDGIYVVYVSTDGYLTQVCDSKFGTVQASTPAPLSGCRLQAAADPAVRLAPHSE